MKIETKHKLRIGVILTMALVLFFYSTTLETEKDVVPPTMCDMRNDSLRAENDSLRGELSTLQIDNGRYEIILDRVHEIDSNVYDKAIKNIE